VVNPTQCISAVADAGQYCVDTNKLFCSVKLISLMFHMKESWHRQGLIQVLWSLKLIHNTIINSVNNAPYIGNEY
jgi:hypothetical protein